MFYEASPALKSSKLLRELHKCAPRESVASYAPNTLHATTHSDYEPWLLAAVTCSGRVVVEAISAVSTSPSPFRATTFVGQDVEAGAATIGVGTDSHQFPCRNAREALRAHNIIAAVATSSIGDTTSSLRLSETFDWIHTAASVWSAPALLHHRRLFRVLNTSHLPTIVSIVETKRDKKRFLMVLTPYNPATEVSPADVLQNNAQQKLRSIHVDPMNIGPTSLPSPSPRSFRAPFIELHERDPDRHTFDAPPNDLVAAIRDSQDDEADMTEEVLSPRSDGVMYTMSLCQVAPTSFLTTVSPDGSMIMVLQPTDLVTRSSGTRWTLPLIVRPTSPLHVASAGMGSLQTDAPHDTITDASLVWAGAVLCHPRVEWQPSAVVVTSFAALFSDGTVRSYVLSGVNVEEPSEHGSGSGREDAASAFSPAERLNVAESTSRRQPASRNHGGQTEYYVHCCGVVAPSLPSSSAAPLPYLTAHTCSATLSPSGGLLAYISRGGKGVVIAPVSAHGVTASSTSVISTTSSSDQLASLVWMPPSSRTHHNTAISGLLAVSQEGDMWWCCASGGGVVRHVEPRNFVLDMQANPFVWDQSPRITVTQRRGVLAAVQNFFGDDEDGNVGALAGPTTFLPANSVGLIAFPTRATGTTPALGAQVMFLSRRRSADNDEDVIPPLLLNVVCSRSPSADHVMKSSLDQVLRSLVKPQQQQQQRSISRRSTVAMDVIASHLFFGATTKTSFGRAWESLLASFPKRDVSLMSRLGIAATEAYLSAVGGALVVPGAMTRLRFSQHQTDLDRSVMGVLPASSCADDVISLKHHVYAILLAHGCVSTLAECGALISTSAVLAGTFEATIVAEIAVAAVLCQADSAHVRVLRSSCSTNTTTVPIWDSLLASCSSQTKKVFDAVYSWETTKAQLAKQDADKAKLIAAGSVAPSSAASADPFPSFIEVERSAVEFMNAVLSFQQPSVDNVGRITTWTRHTIANHFDGVLKILDSELLAFVVYLLLTRAPREVISWLLLFVERAAVVKDHHACLERMIVKLQQVAASQ